MMLHMSDIVFQHEPQCDAIFSKEPDAGKVRLVDTLDGLSEMKIKHLPKGKQLSPRSILIALHGHPFGLLVAWHAQLRIDAKAHRALDVIAGRIDQVSNNLFRAPTTIRR